jgi:hypothetical protein
MGSILFVVQLLFMIIILVMVMPLMAAAGATLAAESVTDTIGDTLHSLLTQGFHPLQLAAVLVFFGPMWTGLVLFCVGAGGARAGFCRRAWSGAG